MNASQPPSRPPQLRPLLGILSRHGVDFVMVGDLAGAVHGSVLATAKLEIACSCDEANLGRLDAALRELEATPRDASVDPPVPLDATTLTAGVIFAFASECGALDVLCEVDGIRDYESLRNAASFEVIDGVGVRIASIDHLIAMKRASSHVKDKLMLEEYIVIADGQKELAKEKKESGEG